MKDQCIPYFESFLCACGSTTCRFKLSSKMNAPMSEKIEDIFALRRADLDSPYYHNDAFVLKEVQSPLGGRSQGIISKVHRTPSLKTHTSRFTHKKGTTTLGMVVREGIVMAVDSRASTGQYIASQTVMKLLKINDTMLGTMAGGAADCQFWFRVLGQECRLWELRTGEKITVHAASKILSNIMFQYRRHDLSMGSMVAGYDEVTSSDEHNFNLYYIDDQGDRIKNNIFCVGSGSIYAYGVLDTEYDFNLTIDQAVDLARRSVYHATHRDCFSGGFVSVYIITKSGWKKVSRDDQTLLHSQYMPYKK